MYCQEIWWRKFVCSAVWANTEQGKYFTNIENGILNPNVTSFFLHLPENCREKPYQWIDVSVPSYWYDTSISVSRWPLELDGTAIGFFIITFTLRFRARAHQENWQPQFLRIVISLSWTRYWMEQRKLRKRQRNSRKDWETQLQLTEHASESYFYLLLFLHRKMHINLYNLKSKQQYLQGLYIKDKNNYKIIVNLTLFCTV
jgi:hypothetical protein